MADHHEPSGLVPHRPPQPPQSRPFFHSVIRILTAVALIVVLVGLFLPAGRENWGAARRIQCVNNLKQIMIALRGYSHDYHAFPPAYTVDASGKPLHSWRTLILPYTEHRELYQSIELSKPWDNPVNSTARAASVGMYMCPSVGTLKQGETIYRAMVGPDACFLPTKPRRLDEITDPRDLTVAVIEGPADKPISWMAPIDADERLFQSLRTSPGSRHPGGANAAMVDGSVKFLKQTCPQDARHAFTTISGNDIDPTTGW